MTGHVGPEERFAAGRGDFAGHKMAKSGGNPQKVVIARRMADVVTYTEKKRLVGKSWIF